jgi:hypothetical protein
MFCWLDGRGSITGKANRIFSISAFRLALEAHPHLHKNGSGDKRPGRDAGVEWLSYAFIPLYAFIAC